LGRQTEVWFPCSKPCGSITVYQQGWPTKKVQSILGHSSITMTMDVYGHSFESPEEDVEMFEKMEADLMVA